MAPTFLGGQWRPFLPSLALTLLFPALPDDVWLETLRRVLLLGLGL